MAKTARPSCRLHHSLVQQRPGLRRGNELDERSGRLLSLRAGHDGDGEYHVLVEVAWKITDVIGPGDGHAHVELLDRHLHLTACDVTRRGRAVGMDGPRFHLRSDPELLDRVRRNDSASAQRVTDRLRIEHGPLESFRRAYVGPGRPRLDGEADRCAGENSAGTLDHLAARDDVIHHAGGLHDQIGGCVGDEPLLQFRPAFLVDDQLVTGDAGIRGRDLVQSGNRAHGRPDDEFGTLRHDTFSFAHERIGLIRSHWQYWWGKGGYGGNPLRTTHYR